MEAQFQYIHSLAKRFYLYAEKTDVLFKALKELSTETLIQVTDEYWNTDSKFQPINLLRATIAKKLLEGEEIRETEVDEIKNYIRKKNRDYFAYLPEHYLQQLTGYPVKEKDMFMSWQTYWSVLQPFFYRSREKEKVRIYLEEIAKHLANELGITDYKYIYGDFSGSGGSGDTRCWIAFYPGDKNSYKEAYQFYVNIKAYPEAGRAAGYAIKERLPNQFKPVQTYKDIIRYLNELKPDILKRNKEIRSFYKYSPGRHAQNWDRFYEEGIMALSFDHLPVGDLNRYQTREELNMAAGFQAQQDLNQTWNLWLFKTANVGDVIFASRGLKTCLGIGIIKGPYYYEDTPDGYCHRRKVEWITNKTYYLKSGELDGYKNLFRIDTFSPTRVYDFILEQYVRNYPNLEKVFKKKGLIKNMSYQDKLDEVSTDKVAEDEITYETPPNLNFWWLNANPKIWSISGCLEGQTQTYTTHNERGNKRRIYKYFEEVKPGDLVIGYESTPVKQVKALLEITKGIHNHPEEGEVIEFQIAEIFEYPVNWNDLKSIPQLKSCEVFINNQGSLFSLSEEEFDIIREVVDEKNISAEKVLQNNEIQPYSFINDPDKPFMKEDDFLRIVSLLKRKMNVILQGPPGVGKTFLAKKIAYELMGETNDLCIEMVQFHQSYSYEDFIQGVRPSANGSFELKDGIFYTFCQRAKAHPEKDYFFVIDEINRGNLSKIFGELMMLIETDKRGWDLKLTYAEDEDERFSVPENLYIIGTMNTADRSLAIVDYALRRRFAFVSLQPDFNDNFREFLQDKGLSGPLTTHIIATVNKINEEIRNDMNLGEGFQIGHSYFCGFRQGEDEQQWWNEIVEYELKPLLEELWFDDLNRCRRMLTQLKQISK